jgi:PAS domain S-box-containing protein
MDSPGRSPVGASALIAASIDGAGLVAGDAFVEANAELAACFGFDGAAALIGTPWTDLYPQADRERIEAEVLPQVRDGEGWRGEVRGVRSDGTTFSQVLSVRATETGDDRFVWIVRDREDASGPDPRTAQDPPSFGGAMSNGGQRPTAQQDLAGGTDGAPDGNRIEPQEIGDRGFQFRDLIETAPVPIVVFTAERGLVYANRRAVTVLGAEDRSAVLGTRPEQFVHPADRSQARRRISRVIDCQEATDPAEYRLRGLDGDERFVEISATPVSYEGAAGAHVVINDITPYKQAKARLRRERQFLETVIDAIDDVFYVMDEDGESYLWNETLEAVTGYSHQEIDEMQPMELIPEDQHEYVPGLMETLESVEDRRLDIDILTKDGERATHEFKGTTFEDPATGDVFRCGLARDITERQERERMLLRQRDELATLDQINRTLLETIRHLVRTADRETIERTICTQLSASDLYEFAWIGERNLDRDGVDLRTIGDDHDSQHTVDAEAGGDGTIEFGPADEAMRTSEVQVVDVEKTGDAWWQRRSPECDGESAAAIPLHHEGTVYGVLVVHTGRESAFSAREREDFAVLGRTIGFVFNAINNHELLFAERATELEIYASDTGSPLEDVVCTLDCELRLQGYVASGRRWILYLELDGTSRTGAIDEVTSVPGVEGARFLDGADGRSRVELILAESALLDTLSHMGTSLRTAVVDPTGIRFVVEAPSGADVREILEQVRSECPDTELLAQHERDGVVTAVGHPDGLLEGLTDRQREVLEAGYRAGYFSWPRESTAEDLATSFNLASATVHGHLRKAEAAILSALFDGE